MSVLRGLCKLSMPALSAALLGSLLTGCQSAGGGQSTCPAVPSAPASYPPPAARAATTAMNLELSGQYMSVLVHSAIEGPGGGSSTASSGVHVQQVSLSEQATAAGTQNLITVRIVPWLRGAQGQQVEVSTRPFDLALSVVPYLVYPATVPDHPTRLSILGGSLDEGLALRFAFAGLRDVANNTPVTCANADLVSRPVLEGVLAQLAGQPAVVVDADSLAAKAEALSGAHVHVIGVNVGSQGTLKLGFAFDGGTSTPFDSTPGIGLVYHGPVDWDLSIDTGFIISAINSSAAAAMAAPFPTATITGGTTTFTKSGIDVAINGRIPASGVCPSFNFTVFTTATPVVGLDSTGTPVLQVPQTPPNFDPGTGQGLAAFCYGVEKTFFGGYSVATVTSSGSCRNVLAGALQISTAAGDTLYGSGVDTDGVFVILGRSKLIDSMSTGRPTLPPCAP